MKKDVNNIAAEAAYIIPEQPDNLVIDKAKKEFLDLLSDIEEAKYQISELIFIRVNAMNDIIDILNLDFDESFRSLLKNIYGEVQ